MRNTGTSVWVVAVALGAVWPGATGGLPASACLAPVQSETTKAFLEHLKDNKKFSAQSRRFVQRAWADRDEDGGSESFIVEALAVLSPEFLSGLDAYEDEDYTKALDIMNALSSDDDPYLAANASVYAIKAQVDMGRLEGVATRIEAFLADPTAVDLYTEFAAEMVFLKGFVQLQNLHYDEAADSLQGMLDQYPEAANRLRVTARQMLAELRSRRPERIGDVNDLMVYAGRQLGLYDTGQRVQQRQQRAVELLEQLIEEAEQREQSGSCGGSGGGQQTPQNPMQDSQLPGGGASGVQLRSTRKVRPGEVWGAMPPAERDKILQTLRDRFPSRYRRLVEQYYQELSKQP